MGKNGKGNVTEVMAVITGTIGAIVICLSTLAGLTQMYLLKAIGDWGLQIAVLGLLMCSSMIGCILASRMIDQKQMVVIVSVVLVLAGMLLVSGLAVDGVFRDVLLNLGALAVGGVASCVLCLKKPRKNRGIKRTYR